MIIRRSLVAKIHQSTIKRCPFPPPRLLSSSNSSNPEVDAKFGRFDEILSFHDGIAAVRERDSSGAYHIYRNGAPVYGNIRYKRTFGFYAQRAAVTDFEGRFFHIDLTGQPVYCDRYSWVGNFHELPEEGLFRSPVRDGENHYYYIDQFGEKTLGPFSYAGDPNSAGQSVVHDLDGNPTIIDVNGRDWYTGPSTDERKLIEACVPHKGIAQVRDEGGWFYMDQVGQDLGRGERYLFAEPHYNGQARVRFPNGQWGVVDETGKVKVSLGESMLSSAVELENTSKRYWESFALKHILQNNVLQEEHQEMPSSSVSPTFREVLEDCSEEMGLIRREQSSENVGNPTVQLLNRGVLLATGGGGGISSVTAERCAYWLQDRYLTAWLDCPPETLDRDTFAELAADPTSVELSQRVLKSYADADWKGAAVVLSKLLPRQKTGAISFAQHKVGDSQTIRTIVDMGGGYGSLLRELQGSGLLKNTEEFICIDRPEVVAAAISSEGFSKSIKHEVGDLFAGELRKADLYLLSRVLHDWSDHRATIILDRLHSMSPEDARLCVIDRVSTPDNLHALLSLHMFALQASHERSHEQWKTLFDASSGWKIDGREHFNGHEMYMLTKKTATPTASAATSTEANHSSGGNSDHNCEDLTSSKSVEAPAIMPTVRKAVITAGGLGTRMAPQSAVTPKALLPIIASGHLMDNVDFQAPRWEVRPALSYILDQFHDSGHSVDQVYVVSTPQQIPSLKSFLQDYQRQQQLTADATTAERKELSVQIVPQHSAGGFGDAVLAARHVIGDEPFVLAVGDHIFSAACVKDVLAAYKAIPSSVSTGFRNWRDTALTGAALCNESEVRQTGLLRNEQAEYEPGSPWLVHDMVEKPRSNYVAFQLSVGGSVRYPSQLVSCMMDEKFVFLLYHCYCNCAAVISYMYFYSS